MNVSADLLSGILVAVVGGGGLWAYLGSRGKTKADLVTIAQDAAGEVVQMLREQIRHLQERTDHLEAQDERCRLELAATRDELADLKKRVG